MMWEWDVIRLLTAILAGALLSFAGSLVQLTARNEIASPSTLGMDGAAVLMVMLAYALEVSGVSLGGLNETALLVGLIFCALCALWIHRSEWSLRGDLRFILLLGLSVNLLVGSFFAIMQFLAMAFNREFPEQLWFGRLQTLTALGWGLSVLVFVPIGIFIFHYRRSWKALLLGPGWCHGLGIPMEKILRQSLLVAFLATVWVVTQFGVFSFVGLLFPLLLRQWSRYQAEPWKEMTDGALIAGFVFALLDHLCFNLTFHGAEIPVGLPSALFGAAALVGLLWRRIGKLAG